MTEQAPPRGFHWGRFLFGFVAPVAAPLAAVVILGGFADPWVFIIVWTTLFAVGLGAGLKHRNWEFMTGMLAAVAVFSAIVAATRIGWLSW
jgi:hypothetical protein